MKTLKQEFNERYSIGKRMEKDHKSTLDKAMKLKKEIAEHLKALKS